MKIDSVIRLAVITIFISTGTVRLHSQDLVFKNSGTKGTLIELYTSEGCSSCPPAEAWLGKLKTSPMLWKQIFPVAFHVDYWDGQGWPDRFATPAYTQRQRDYAANLGQDSVYTPEFITSGREWRGWFQGEQEPPAPAATSGELALNLQADGKIVSASYVPAAKADSQEYTINFALLGINIVSDVKAGENGGNQLHHDFIVLDFKSGPLRGGPSLASGRFTLKPITDDRPGAAVAWVSDSSGRIVQVAGGWLNSAHAAASASDHRD